MGILKHPSSTQNRSTHGVSNPSRFHSTSGRNFVDHALSGCGIQTCFSGHVSSDPDCSEKFSSGRVTSGHLSAANKLIREQPSCSASMPINALHRIPKNQSSKQDNSARDNSSKDDLVVAGSESEISDTRCFLLWIDGVGVWQLLMGNHFVIGAPSSKGPEADLAIQANVRKQHASLLSERDDWLLDPLAETFIGNQRVAKKAHLQSGDQIRLGESVELGFRLPSPLSHSAVLDFESGHRPLQSVDGVILLTDHCIVGPRRDQHIYCSTWQHSFVLFRRDNKLLCRSSGDFQFNGTDVDDVCEIDKDSMIESEHCRFRVEVIR